MTPLDLEKCEFPVGVAPPAARASATRADNSRRHGKKE